MGEGGASSRRSFLGALGGTGLLAIAGCTDRTTSASIDVPEEALVDERIEIELEGLPTDGEPVTVRAHATSSSEADRLSEWSAHAVFEPTGDGTVDIATQAPLEREGEEGEGEGEEKERTYEETDPMGLFWSKRPDSVPAGERVPDEAWFVPAEDGYDVRLTAAVDGETVAEATTTRSLFDPDIEERTVDHDGLVGEFYAPPGDDPAPGALLLHGAGGQLFRSTGRLLASRGIATLAIQYFGDPDPIPDHLVEVPLEYAETAVAWLLEADRVAGSRVGVFGFSRGGELALLLGSRSEAVGAVVGWVPSGLVWEGLGPNRSAPGASAWTDDGEPVPFLERADAGPESPPFDGLPSHEPALEDASEDELAAAAIPAEEIGGPVLLVSATDDRRWPSTALSERVVDRLATSDYDHEFEHLRNENAGHYLTYPYLPTVGTETDGQQLYGGTPRANARAARVSWERTLDVLRDVGM